MAFDDILGIPISFEDDESEGNQERNGNGNGLWDAESYWALDTKDIWKTKEPVLRERGDIWKNSPTISEEDNWEDENYEEEDCEADDDNDFNLDLDPFDEDEEG